MVTYKKFELQNKQDILDAGFILMDDLDVSIKHKMMELVKESNLNLSDIGRLTGIPRQSVNMVFYSKVKPTLEFALKMSYIFNMPVNEIFELDDTAWIQPIKSKDESAYYYDSIEDTVITSQEKITKIKKTKKEFYNTENPEIQYSKSEGLRLINRKDFKDNILPIYRRIGEKIEPYVIRRR